MRPSGHRKFLCLWFSGHFEGISGPRFLSKMTLLWPKFENFRLSTRIQIFPDVVIYGAGKHHAQVFYFMHFDAKLHTARVVWAYDIIKIHVNCQAH